MRPGATIIEKFKQLWMFYILQSLLAGIVMVVIVFMLGNTRMVVISAIGATAFIVFAMPRTVAAKTRNVLGGHLVGLATGCTFYLAALPYLASFPLTVIVAMFLMVALDVEHPPAAGTALAVVSNEVSPDVFLTILISILVLSQTHYYLRNHLRDLV